MEINYHPLVRRDVAQTLKYYRAISSQLADEFHAELRDIINKVVENPLRFHFADRGFRRANLPRFPYHVLYEIHGDFLRVMILRHNKRHPDFGLDRT